MGIRENIEEIRAKAKGVLLLAVTKNVELPQVIEAVEAGITDIGESYVQEARTKIPEIKARFPDLCCHLIGHLQTNKVNTALKLFDVIQSVDSLHLAEEISKRVNKPVEIFIEVNTSGEESKFGVPPEKAGEFIGRITGFPGLRITGLMTVGNGTRECFRKLREIREKVGVPGLKLSMGMTHDFALAIEEGSDIIRVGTGIFGTRGGY